MKQTLKTLSEMSEEEFYKLFKERAENNNVVEKKSDGFHDKFSAIKNNNLEEIAVLINKNIQFTSEDISFAIIHDGLEVVKFFIDKVKIIPDHLSLAVIHNRIKISKLLIQKIQPTFDDIIRCLVYQRKEILLIFLGTDIKLTSEQKESVIKRCPDLKNVL